MGLDAIITVAAMFVLSDALLRTGAVGAIGRVVARLLEAGQGRSICGLTTIVGGISAFVNNTPVVAALIPIVADASRKRKVPASRFLMPLSYGAIFGGACTLIGTSTNLLVSGIAEDKGLRPFSMFLLTPLGLVFFAVGTTYLLLVGRRLIPERGGGEEFASADEIHDYLAEVAITADLDGENRFIKDIFKEGEADIDVLEIDREGDITKDPADHFELAEGDVLLVKGDMGKINKLLERGILHASQAPDQVHFPKEGTQLVEIVVLPNSDLVEKRIREIEYFNKHNSNVLAIRQRGRERIKDLKDVALRPGDILLLQTNQEGLELLEEIEREKHAPFLSMRKRGVEKLDARKLVIVLATMATMVVLAATGLVPIVIGALGAVAVLNFARVITMQDAYKAIDWKVIFLLAGALSLGAAMNQSGISAGIGNFLADEVGSSLGPVAVISALYLATSIFTEIMSNNAAAALLAPVAISVAGAMDVDATPMLLAVTFAGSASFMTPVGYQTNTMVYSAGNYRFTDFTRVGAPLNLLFWLLATWLIPILYPF